MCRYQERFRFIAIALGNWGSLEDLESSLIESPIFSIILPTHNRGQYLFDALQSVLSQTLTSWELLIIDNNSIDNTVDIINGFNDPRLRLYQIDNLGCIAKSRNLGIKKSKGTWLAFLDSDDLWENDKLERCKKLINKNVDFMYHDMKVISGHVKRKNLKCRQLKSPVFKDLLLNGNPIAASSVIVRKEVLVKVGGFNQNVEMNSTADYNAWLKISKFTESFLHLDSMLGSYRFHSENISNDQILEPTMLAVQEFLPYLSTKQHKKLVSNLTYIQGYLKFLSRNFKESRIDLVNSLRSSNYRFKIKTILILALMMIKIK
jgi:glycosyltransferase involved in cell wall biosynthesis